MSLLTDRDLLLHQFQLAYLRHVLPNHAPLTSAADRHTPTAQLNGHTPTAAPGTGPYNLISFPPPRDLRAQSPYLAHSASTDPELYPELSFYSNGRRSPPIALQVARRGLAGGRGASGAGSLQPSGTTTPVQWVSPHSTGASEDGSGSGTGTGPTADQKRRRRTAGPGPLGYTQTIVGGSRSSRRIRSEGVHGADGEAAPIADDARAPATSSPGGRRDDQDQGRPNAFPSTGVLPSADLRARPPPAQGPDGPAASVAPNPLRPPPPPVVVHSPPASQPRSLRPEFDHPPPPPLPPLQPSFQSQISGIPVRSGLDDRAGGDRTGAGGGAPAAPAPLSALRFADLDPPAFPVETRTPTPEEEDFGASSSEEEEEEKEEDNEESSFSPPDRGTVSDGLAEAGGMVGRARATTESSMGSTAFGTASTSTAGGGGGGLSSPGPPRNGNGGGRRSMEDSRPAQVLGSSASELEAAAPSAADVPASSTTGASHPNSNLAPAPTPAAPRGPAAAPAPVFQLPPGLRVRERRRVNIRGGMGVFPIPAPAAGPAAGPVPSLAAVQAPVSGATQTGGGEPAARPESQDGGEGDGPSGQPGDPPTLAVPTGPDASSGTGVNSGHRSSETDLDATHSLSRPASPGRAASRSPKPLFPPRSEYILASLNRGPHTSSSFAAPSRPDQKSGLSLLLGAGGAGSGSASRQDLNPFSRLYASCVSRASDAVRLTLYFPFLSPPAPGSGAGSRAGKGKKGENKVEIGVKRDVTVEEVIGIGLWACWEEEDLRARVPFPVEEQEAREGRETVKWNLRIVEDDGEVDEDFPALDRVRNLSAFSFNEFAIVRATDPQIEDNAAKQATITRRPSRILVSTPSRPSPAPVAVSAPTALPARNAAMLAVRPAGSALSIPVNLIVRAPPSFRHAERVDLQVPSDMYMIDVLHAILQRLALPSDSVSKWVLVVRLADGDIVVPPDRTVESLGEQHTLDLVPRDEVGPAGLRRSKTAEGHANPADPLFNDSTKARPRRAQLPVTPLVGLYEHFSVLRKVPMSLGGRHARVIALDGDYIHFMPPDGTSGRTTSFHVSKVRTCRISRRSASSFKIVVTTKRYDFEADSPERAREIVERIREVVEGWRVEQRQQVLQPRGQELSGFAAPAAMAATAPVGSSRGARLRRRNR
ncbi:hypothetical protein JCM8202_005047 [Rhodotorula sphaerocarpa]